MGLFSSGKKDSREAKKAGHHSDKKFDRDDYKFVIDSDVCISCGSCMGGCKHGAIKMTQKGGKDVYSIDHTKCKKCGHCIKNCPVDAIK